MTAPPSQTVPLELEHYRSYLLLLARSHDGMTADEALSRGSMVVYALPDGDGDTRANYTARFDNFRVTDRGAGGD